MNDVEPARSINALLCTMTAAATTCPSGRTGRCHSHSSRLSSRSRCELRAPHEQLALVALQHQRPPPSLSCCDD